jgi:acetyl esterase/lipase
MPDLLTVNLWSGRAPLATGDDDADVPQIVFHPAADAGGGCVLVLPGGGYGNLAPHEGVTISEFFAARGISAAVLRYRHAPKYRHPAPLLDVSRAMRTLRHRAGEWRFDPHRIAVMGFSAGGHLASTLCTHFDAGDANASDPIERESSRPDLGILCYPVIAMRGPYAHVGSRNNLLGDREADKDLRALLSNEEHVTPQTPPTFLFHTADDDVVMVENAIEYASALRRSDVPFALHIYEHGRHGVGLASDDPALSSWSGLLVTWLGGHGWNSGASGSAASQPASRATR